MGFHLALFTVLWMKDFRVHLRHLQKMPLHTNGKLVNNPKVLNPYAFLRFSINLWAFVWSFVLLFVRSFMIVIMTSFIHSFIRPSVRPSFRLFLPSLLPCLLASSLPPSLPSSLPFFLLPASFIRSFIHLFIYLFIYSLVCSFVRSMKQSFMILPSPCCLQMEWRYVNILSSACVVHMLANILSKHIGPVI